MVSTTLVGCCPSQRALAQNRNESTDEHGCFAAPNILSGQLYPMFDAMLQDLSGELAGMNYSFADSIKMAEFVFKTPSMPPRFSNQHQPQLLP